MTNALAQARYKATPPTLQSEQTTDLQTDDRGNLKTISAVGGSAISATNPMPVTSGSLGEYETVAASQTAQALGATGAVGDYLEGLIIVVATAATAQVQIKDGSDSAITVFPNSPGGGVGTYPVPIGLKSRTGAWQITTGAGSSVIAVGNFT